MADELEEYCLSLTDEQAEWESRLDPDYFYGRYLTERKGTDDPIR